MRREPVKVKNGTNAEGKSYLTKRMLLSTTAKAIKDAAAKSMEVQGFNIIAEDGWVVKVLANGEREKIRQLSKIKRPAKIILN